jgi:hypothetical protein
MNGAGGTGRGDGCCLWLKVLSTPCSRPVLLATGQTGRGTARLHPTGSHGALSDRYQLFGRRAAVFANVQSSLWVRGRPALASQA